MHKFKLPLAIILVASLVLLNADYAKGLVKHDKEKKSHRYSLVFYDDFKGNHIDTTSWNIIQRNRYAWGKYMSNHPSLYQLRKGALRLSAVANDGVMPSDTASYITAGISTEGKRTITYGKVEVRARFHGAVGSWPAMWLFRSEPSKTWPDPEYAEIDIVEYPNTEDYVMQTVHNYYTMHLKKTNSPVNSARPKVKADSYNIYTVEVLPDAVVYSINGKETFRYPNIRTKETGQYPFGCELYLMLDMQVGATWLPKPDKTTYPAYMDIDWVRMYKLLPTK